MNIAFQKLNPSATIPNYAHPHDAGMDLYASVTMTIAPQQRAVVPTGIALAIPEGYVGLVWDKSGLATTNGIITIAGVIDAGYRGEIQVAVYNLSTEPYQVLTGKKIAQLLIQPLVQAKLEVVEQLPDSHRGVNGFGSTGL